MSFLAPSHCRTKIGAGRVLLVGLSWLLAASSWAASAPTVGRVALARLVSPVAIADKPDPEVLLIDVYKELGANHLNKALAKADQLVEAYPNFRLGHLIRGDLLLMHTRPVTTFGAVNGPEEKLKNLREEAMV